MIRVDTRISERDYANAANEARRLGLSMPQYLRYALKQLLATHKSKPWMRYAGMIESGDKASSRNIDSIVYRIQKK